MSSFTARTRISFVIALCAVALLCAPVSAVRAQETKPFAAFSNSAQALRDSVVAMAKAQLGTKYRRGGEEPGKGFDCSGLVRYVLSALNVALPRTARQQATAGVALSRDTSQLLPGDLLTFGKTKKGVSHVAIYIGDGKYIHASTSKHKVVESTMNPRSSLIKIWAGARRVLSLNDSGAPSTVLMAATPKGDPQP
ncbi:MAG TPA: C40 family peptidase [Gemmatimonadaceae bacterium]|jgi:cell wall-associated NlpC family hydrolase